ncbi:isoprenoid biosynthesis glyoxalase ElbB [Desulfuromonas thiophila]|uniref:isoprenoid biosynthesis glyoxalase ElbB n=1 Tax=Desulfuromonas thiophila TaxID=57664 RepID=UPI0024A83375|nr:isoprenoid biosynthesis glyoxalase ElbB [Desulfuromonas thiophila]
MATVGVILAGCGVYDGSEIHEAVLALLALDRAGVKVQCLAPDKAQMHVVNHQSGDVAEGESRQILVEAARIARGNVLPLGRARAEDFDALVLPGGFGAAKNLCNFAIKGADCDVDEEVAALIRALVAAGKPIAAICIAPVLLARILGSDGRKPRLTIGSDSTTATAMSAMGAEHVPCPVDDCVVDTQLKLVTTPAYMLARSITEAARGIDKTIQTLIGML